MNPKQQTAYCGIFCPDCVRFNNQYSGLANDLKKELEKIEFRKYAEINSPFSKGQFKKYKEFQEVLDALSQIQCQKPCRVGGGCSGVPCEIMKCCISNDYEGCWQCDDLDGCGKFAIIEPQCGGIPKENARKIKKHGIENWLEYKGKFYIWKK